MKKSPWRLNVLSQIIGLPFIIVMILLLSGQLLTYGNKNDDIQLRHIQETLEKYAIQCYASEGSYPPHLDYLVENYGLILNEDKYNYEYHIFASNIMPDIGVSLRPKGNLSLK